MPETLDRVLDTLPERYGIATPLGEFPVLLAGARMAPGNDDGWMGRA